jgi:hypothetical protein
VTGWQIVALWAMLGLAAFGIPGYTLGWWNGRRCLRAALDPGQLRPVPEPHTRSAPAALPTTGRFPAVDDRPPFDTAPLIIMSEHYATLADYEREVRELVAEGEKRFGRGHR